MKKTIAQIVAENKERALVCGTPKELYQLAIDLGFDSRAAFPRYKAALLSVCGIDYAAVKAARQEQRAEALAATVTESLTLFVDAKARCQRFAICDSTGSVVWYGRFFEDDMSFSYGDRDEQSACECAVARKAIWFASQVRNAVCAPGKTIRLTLKVDAQWLVTLSGKASVLVSDAQKFNIELHVEWIAGTSNPADRWTTASSFKKWNDNDLSRLVDSAIEAKKETVIEAKKETVPVVIAVETVTIQAHESDNRTSTDRSDWFSMMGADWPKMRDEMKQRGMSSSARDVEVNKMISEWVQAGKPVTQAA